MQYVTSFIAMAYFFTAEGRCTIFISIPSPKDALNAHTCIFHMASGSCSLSFPPATKRICFPLWARSALLSARVSPRSSERAPTRAGRSLWRHREALRQSASQPQLPACVKSIFHVNDCAAPPLAPRNILREISELNLDEWRVWEAHWQIQFA